MKAVSFIFLLSVSLFANPLLILEKKIDHIALSLNKQGNQYFLKVNLNPTNKATTVDSSNYYIVGFDDFLKIRKINQYKIDRRNQEKITLEILFFPNENVEFLKETTIDDLKQERRFNEQGYLLEDSIFFPQGGNKSKKYGYDNLGNIINITYYENQLLISEKRINIINQEERRIDFFDIKKELYQYQIEKTISFSENDYEKTITTYSPLDKKVLFQREYYTNALLKKAVLENQREIDYFYNEKNQLIKKSIRGINSDYQQNFRYFYSDKPQESYLLFNPYFRVNSLTEQKNYWEKQLEEDIVRLKNNYQDLVFFSSLEKENDQFSKVRYQFYRESILAYHYKNNKIIKKEIYDNFGNKKSEDSYSYYINDFLASREFSSRDFIRKRKITFFYQELPLNKNGYENCKNNNEQIEIIDFNFANLLFQQLYLAAQNSSLKSVSFQKDFLDFKNQLLQTDSPGKKLLQKLYFIENCKINKMIITDKNNKIINYVRIIFKQKKQEKQVIFNYHQEPNFDYFEKYDLKFYEKTYPSLIEKTTPEQEKTLFDEKREFLNKANDKIAPYKERIHNQFSFHYHSANQLIFAQKNCYDSSGEIIGSIFIYPKRVILDKNQRCRLTYFTEN